MDKLNRLRDLEGKANDVIARGTVLGALHKADRAGVLSILLQRRFLTFCFTPMCEFLMCALDDEAARQVVASIIGDEYRETNHRLDYLAELEGLGVPRHAIYEEDISASTQKAATQILKSAMELRKAGDLRRLVFLRYMGEVSAGYEFNQLYHRLQDLGALDHRKSRFLEPHIRYDVTGGKEQSHADKYRDFIVDRVKSDADWVQVDEVLRQGARIRRLFYQQFPVPI